jgi:glycosyltransferase involved in cell wall biosynthesis
VKVLHLASSDYSGGAARAMYRWHSSLRKLGVSSRILCLNKSTTDKSVSAVAPDWEDQATIKRLCLQSYFIDSNRTDYSNTYFSHPLGYASIADHELVQEADLVHVHWTSLFFDWRELRKIKSLGKAVVLTPHDLWAVTGGCHFPKGCDGYLKECLNCPMLKRDPYQLISFSRALKLGVIADVVDAIVSPSHWMDKTMGEVEALKGIQRAVIPYCVDVTQFRGKPKASSKRRLGFDTDRLLVLFCAEYVTEGRKGLDALVEVMKICETRPEFRAVLEGHAQFAIIGKGSELVEIPTLFQVDGRGYVKKTEDLCHYYSAADLLIYLGVEDNLPNVILEAMASGLPVLAFDTGGVGDMITEGVTGHLIRRGDVTHFAERLVLLLRDYQKLSWLALHGPETTRRRFSEHAVGLELRKLYESLDRRPTKAMRADLGVFEKAGFEFAAEKEMGEAMILAYRSLAQKSEELEERNATLQKQSESAHQKYTTLQEQSEAAQRKYDLLEGRLREYEELIQDLRSTLVQLGHPVAEERSVSLWALFLRRLKERLERFIE